MLTLKKRAANASKSSPRTTPDGWHRFSVMSHLGAALAGQRKYDEAERFLVEGYDGLKARAAQIPEKRPTRLDKSQLEDAAARVISFYETTGNVEKGGRIQGEDWPRPRRRSERPDYLLTNSVGEYVSFTGGLRKI